MSNILFATKDGSWLIGLSRTTDTSFVDNPPTSSKATPKFTTPAPSRTTASSGRGGSSGGSGSSGRGIPVPRGRGGRASGLARGRGRGVR